MTGSWGEHREAVDVAKNAIGELQEAIANVTDRQETALGAVYVAIGESQNESATTAAGLIAEVKDMTEGMTQRTQQAIEELERYARGF